MDPRWLAAKLREQGLVDDAQLTAALAHGGDFCLQLLKTGAIEESALLRFLGLQFQTRYISTEKLSQANIPEWVLELLSPQLCEDLKVLPVRCDKQRTALSIVTPDPTDSQVIDAVRQTTGVQQVQAHVALPHAIDAAIKKLYKGDIHAFARLDRLLEADFNQILETYDGRLIDFDEQEPYSVDPASGAGLGDPGAGAVRSTDLAAEPTGPSLPAVSPMTKPSRTSPAAATPRRHTMVSALVRLLEMGHGWRRGHSSQVATRAVELGEKLGLAAQELDDLRLAAILHEVGKPLETHLTLLDLDESPRLRALAHQVWMTPLKLLGRADLPPGVVQILSAQYERLAGDGVPGKLAGEAIPRAARVLAAVDMAHEARRNPRHGDDAFDRLWPVLQQLFDQGTAETAFEYLDGAVGATAQPRRVVVIDEDAEAARALEIDLAGAGFEVQSLRNTAEAARAVLTSQIDLIITEVDLRPVDGFDFLQRIRSDARTSSVPVIFLTGRGDAADVSKGLELGAASYLVKPYETHELLTQVEAAVPQLAQDPH